MGPNFMTCLGLLSFLVIYVLIGLFLLLRGTIDCLRTSQPRRIRGVLKIFSGLLMIAILLGGPHVLFYSQWGRPPASHESLNRIDKGMSKEQVLSILGTPFVRSQDDRNWTYYFSVIDDVIAITYDEQGRVNGIYPI